MNEMRNKNVTDFFDGLYLLSERNKNIIHTIKLFSKSAPEYFTYVNFDKLPNISTTLNNKIVEIGIFYREHKLSFYDQSPLSHIILCDLCSYVTNGFNDLDDYFEATHIITCQTPISKHMPQVSEPPKEQLRLGNIINYIKDCKSRKDSLNKQEYLFRANLSQKLHALLANYLNTDRTLFNYSLDKDLSNSILNFFIRNPNSYTKSNIHEIQNELELLNMTSIVPKLREELRDSINNNEHHTLNNNYDSDSVTWLNCLPQSLQDAFRQTDLQQYNMRLNTSINSNMLTSDRTTSKKATFPTIANRAPDLSKI